MLNKEHAISFWGHGQMLLKHHLRVLLLHQGNIKADQGQGWVKSKLAPGITNSQDMKQCTFTQQSVKRIGMKDFAASTHVVKGVYIKYMLFSKFIKTMKQFIALIKKNFVQIYKYSI